MDTMSAKQIEIAGLPAFGTDSATARRLGAVMGLAVGDALGTTFEFRRIDQPNYPTLATGPATDVTGGGPFVLPAGAITDDTQMAVCIARSLVEQPGPHIDTADLAQRYLAWFEHAFDVGTQTAAALTTIKASTPPHEAGRFAWIHRGRRDAGNGSLMRTAPIGVRFTGDAVIEEAIADALLTHADPRCVIATAAFDASIAAAIVRADLMNAARAAIPVAAAKLRELWDGEDEAAIASAVSDIWRDLDAAEASEPGVYGAELDVHRTAGFVRVAFRLAYWHAVHTPSWRDAVVDTASRGGDADTNAAIVGALLGARDGVDAIPRPWLDRVLGAKQRGNATWGEAHHPRHFLALVASR
jgi:ADP-ribosyl-[dinitrogen reductase] hydrolase